MKKRYLAWVMLLCLLLSGCNGSILSSLGLDLSQKDIDTTPLPTEGTTEVTTEATTEVTTEATTAPATEPATEPTTAPTTTPTTAPTAPTADTNGVTYTQVEAYPIPIANPAKDIYDAPAGNYLRDFGTTGYYTIVEQAEDANGYVWGRLSTGEGWTMVYQQILPDLHLTFCSGAGAWSTELDIAGVGYFSGGFHDSDMGDYTEQYPNGTVYTCGFDGYFMVTGINTHSISLEILRMNVNTTEGITWIENGYRYIGSVPYGLDGGDQYLLYFPETPISELPSEVFSWGFSRPSSGTLGCYALYCPASGYTFFSN